MREAERVDRLGQKRRSPDIGLHEYPPGLRPELDQRQARDSTTAAEINGLSRCGRHQGAKGQAVVELRGDGSRPEKPSGPPLGQHLTEPGEPRRRRSRLVRQRGAGRIMTRRRGSSPSEVVVTPSRSFTVSWTIFRSAALIGSSAFLVPRLLTSSAS